MVRNGMSVASSGGRAAGLRRPFRLGQYGGREALGDVEFGAQGGEGGPQGSFGGAGHAYVAAGHGTSVGSGVGDERRRPRRAAYATLTADAVPARYPVPVGELTVLVLLPPSEGKAASGRGAPLKLESLSLPGLTDAREAVLGELVELCVGGRGQGP